MCRYALGILPALFLFLTSCVNNEYDINKDIVTDATLFEGVALSLGDIKKIEIDEILFGNDAEVTGLYADENGDYNIDFTTGDFSASIDVPEFSLEGIRLEDQSITFGTNGYAGLDTSMLPAFTIAYSDIVPGGLQFNMDITLDTEIPSEIVSISDVYLDASLTCNFEVTEGVLYVKEGFELAFPDYIFISEGSDATDYEVVDSHIIRFVKDAAVNASSPLSLEMNFDAISVPSSFFVTKPDGTRWLQVDDVVKVNGDFYIRSLDFDVVPQLVKLVMYVEMDKLDVVEAKVSMEMNADIPDEVFNLNDVPEIMKGDNLCIDLYNPMIYLGVGNTSPFAFSINADITAYSGNKEYGVHLGNQNANASDAIYVAADSRSEFVVSRRQVQNLAQGQKNIVVPQFGDIIKVIPDAISIHDINVKSATQTAVIKPGSTYNASVAYRLTTPLAFDNEFYINYSLDLENLDLYLEDAWVKSAEIRMNLINSVPVDFNISAKCLDSDGNVRNDVTVTLNDSIKAGTHQNPTDNALVIRLDNASKELNISALRLTLEASSSNPELAGVCLNRNQGFEIKDILIALPDGVGVNFSSNEN